MMMTCMMLKNMPEISMLTASPARRKTSEGVITGASIVETPVMATLKGNVSFGEITDDIAGCPTGTTANENDTQGKIRG